MKLLVDMNLSPRWVETLAGAGMHAVHWSTVGAKDAADAEIMAYAVANDYIVLTYDLDFGAILAATSGSKPSVVQIRADDVNPDAIGPQVLTALQKMDADLKAGALLTVDPIRARLRVLPLRSEDDR
jgi:predicted nuclease of predicted toxin-antitoxin system